VSNAITVWQKSFNEICQTNPQKMNSMISAFRPIFSAARGWQQGEWHPQRETIDERKKSHALVLGLERKKLWKHCPTARWKCSQWARWLVMRWLFMFHKVRCLLLICFLHSTG